MLDPNPLSANEYLSEFYVKTGTLDLTRERLAKLANLCGKDCEERRDLAAIVGTPHV